MDEKQAPFLSNDAVILGLLIVILGLIFYTSSSKHPLWVRFYKVVPAILLCYFIPALLNTFNIISGEKSQLYPIASRYFLPASIVLLTIGIDVASLRKLGGKSIFMFFTACFGVLIGGPLIILLTGCVAPHLLVSNNEEIWRGLATIAGSWIGGGANQAAMLEIFGASKNMFGQMVAIDVMVAYVWMAVLLYATRYNDQINRWLKADSRSICEIEKKMELIYLSTERKHAGTREGLIILAVAFGVTGLSHFLADNIAPFFTLHYPNLSRYSLTSSFFWLIGIATAIGLALSFTKVQRLEAYGASDTGSIFLYILVACIGTNMNLFALFDRPVLLLLGFAWISIHIITLIAVARIIKAPFFFVAVGSQASIGGPVSAPVVAAAFNKYLAPVGVLLAILGYAVGTYAAYLCGLMMQFVSDHMLT